MPTIYLTTKIKAPIEKMFDLARNLDLHKISTGNSNEEAIGGVTSGLINQGEEVTWRATHIGIRQTLTTYITKMERPYYFQDVMKKGTFKKMRHDHFFEQKDEYTLMKDVFYFESPFGVLGILFNKLYLIRYMKALLEERNRVLKEYGENNLL